MRPRPGGTAWLHRSRPAAGSRRSGSSLTAVGARGPLVASDRRRHRRRGHQSAAMTGAGAVWQNVAGGTCIRGAVGPGGSLGSGHEHMRRVSAMISRERVWKLVSTITGMLGAVVAQKLIRTVYRTMRKGAAPAGGLRLPQCSLLVAQRRAVGGVGRHRPRRRQGAQRPAGRHRLEGSYRHAPPRGCRGASGTLTRCYSNVCTLRPVRRPLSKPWVNGKVAGLESGN